MSNESLPKYTFYLPLQGASLQGCVSKLFAMSIEHSSPPFSGFGLLQCRVLFWVDPPHVTGQAFQLPHSPQLPLILSGPSKMKKRRLKTSTIHSLHFMFEAFQHSYFR